MKETLSDKRIFVRGLELGEIYLKEEDVKEFLKELKEDIFHEICWDVTKVEEGYSPSYYKFRNQLIKKIIKKYEKRIDKLAGEDLI